MSLALRPPRARWGVPAGLREHIGEILFAVGAGIVIGLQYITPNKRVIPVIVAITLFGLTWRVDMVTGIGILLLALPFPRGTVFGSTNLAFVLLLLIIWLLRVTMRQSDPPRSTPADTPLLALFLCYTVSFYNVDAAKDLQQHFEAYLLELSTWIMFFMFANNIRSERDFKRLLNFQAVSVAMVCLVAVYELTHPGQPLVKGWLDAPMGTSEYFALHEVRVGSVFFDYELLCEYCALNSLLTLFLFVRANSGARRVVFGGLLLLDVFILFATVTRGGIIALAVGAAYLLWLVRRRLTLVSATIVLGILAALAIGMNYYVGHFTRSGDVFTRLTRTTFVGMVPDSRVGAWEPAWARIWEHPLIGHGPAYTLFSGRHQWGWPHSIYLYVANNVGFIGVGVFLWLVFTLLWISRPRTDDLRGGDYVQSYLLVAHVQMVVFIVDEIKIDFLRNTRYEFQVWVMFALLVAAHQTLRAQEMRTARGIPATAGP